MVAKDWYDKALAEILPRARRARVDFMFEQETRRVYKSVATSIKFGLKCFLLLSFLVHRFWVPYICQR